MAHPNAWSQRSADVRDLHRKILEGEQSGRDIAISHTVSDLRPHTALLYPEIGSASRLAQPGGFRRAFVSRALSDDGSLLSRLAEDQPLTLSYLTNLSHGRTPGLTSDVVQEMSDGSALRFRSRGYRLGHRPELLRVPSTLQPPVPQQHTAQAGARRRLQLCGIRPRSAPYWSAVTFLIGSLLFLVGSVAWMVPALGDEAHGASALSAELSVTYPFLVGSICFTVGCYLALVVVVNANLGEEVRQRERAAIAAADALAAAAPPHSPHSPFSPRSPPPQQQQQQPQQQQQQQQPQPPAAQQGADEDTTGACQTGPQHLASPRLASPPANSLAPRTASFVALPLQESVHGLCHRLVGGGSQLRRTGSSEPRLGASHAHLGTSHDSLGSSHHSRAESALRPSPGDDDDEVASCGEDEAEDEADEAPPLRWWGFQPRSVLYWGALSQLLGALLFNVACYAGLPGVIVAHRSPLATYLLEMWSVWLPSVVGSLGFTFASWVYFSELVHSYSVCARPEPTLYLGWLVCVLNLVGSALFLIASLCYFARVVPHSDTSATPSPPSSPPPSPSSDPPSGAWGWAFEVSEWGVRFPFALGSACFLAGAAGAIVEILNDDADPALKMTEAGSTVHQGPVDGQRQQQQQYQ